ncbi:hypothetical protein [Olleya sp. R77988]|uniref:hypothetical protein n=1 Tax=Olleya sp. R77988 TaxID=3093875 RepID=UPI0037C53DED
MRHTTIIIALLVSFLSFCQENIDENLIETIANNSYLHNYNIENFYLHTNKNYYFSEENIDFKAYVVNEINNKPNLETTNLHINLYDFDNKLVLSHLFHVKDGKSFGTIKLPKDLKSGEYILQLDTQWNRNFKEGSNFSITIKNLNEISNNSTNATIKNTTNINNTKLNNLPITFFTKSGILLKNTENTIYFKLKNKDDAYVVGGIVDNKLGREIAKIIAINNDYAKCNFFYDSDYTAVFYHDDKDKKIKLPAAKKIGFALLKSALNNNEVINFQLKTNRETIINKKNKFIYAVLHKKGYLKTKASFNLSENIQNYNFNILKADLFNGTNTISIFDNQNKIIAEKSFYYKNNLQIDVSAKIIEQKKDSAIINLKLNNYYKKSNISISVIHKDNEVVDYNSKITNTLSDKIVVFNTPEGIDPFFNKKNLGNSFIYQKKTKQKLLYDKEFGIRLKGQLNSTLKNPTNYQVTLSSNTNNIFTSTSLNADKTFKFNKLYLTHPSEFALLLLNKNGKSQEARFYVYNHYVDYQANNMLKSRKIKTNFSTILDSIKTPLKTSLNIDLPLSKDAELLDEVVLDNIKKREQKRIKEIKKENPFLAINAGHSRDYLIDPNQNFMTLEQYLRTIQGIRVYNDTSFVRVLNKRMGNGLNNGTNNLVSISIDNTFVSQEIGGLPNPFRPVTDFELISVNLSGLGNGTRYENGIINLITRKGKSVSNKNQISKVYKTSNGFNKNQQDITENSLFFPNKSSKNAFSTLDWLPDITLNPNTSNIIKIKKPKTEHVRLIINGISDDGDLIYKIIDL